MKNLRKITLYNALGILLANIVLVLTACSDTSDAKNKVSAAGSDQNPTGNPVGVQTQGPIVGSGNSIPITPNSANSTSGNSSLLTQNRDYKLGGKIVDAKTGLTIPGAEISIIFSIPAAANYANKYTLKAKSIGAPEAGSFTFSESFKADLASGEYPKLSKIIVTASNYSQTTFIPTDTDPDNLKFSAENMEIKLTTGSN